MWMYLFLLLLFFGVTKFAELLRHDGGGLVNKAEATSNSVYFYKHGWK